MAPSAVSALRRRSDVAGEELIESADAEAEVREKLQVPTPTSMTTSELAEHRDGGHLPYRSNCPDCVEAFGREEQHVHHDKTRDRMIPVISLDYFFVTPSAVYTHKELEAADPAMYAQR